MGAGSMDQLTLLPGARETSMLSLPPLSFYVSSVGWAQVLMNAK